MTDRYLFKAKTEGGRWIEGDLIHYESGEVAILERPFSKYGYEASEISRRTLVLPETLCQYTGLTDKNGNKIWENDVVKEESCGYVGVVKYVDCEYLIDWNDFPYIRRDMMFWVEERGLKAIGTKFDNPELLGG